ncbi:MAG: NH(3)-dependent NAD(+) synthetase [Chlorobi bacterium OLB7]|nr:MAG: NH(3)-dependent NAD(+) synthetase [Chlorobi bacterium OLB7]
MMNRSLTELRSSLESLIASYGTAVVGYSAGVDSSVVAAAAKSALGSNALAVTAVTETITTDDLLLASQVAEQLEIAHQWLYYNELDIPNYASNPTNRCYFCKDALYARLRHVANENGYNAVLDGSNADDAGDYRPGRQAAAEQGVRSPLLELGITKAEVRQLAEQYGLPNHDKPSAPCLSSRVPTARRSPVKSLKRLPARSRHCAGLGLASCAFGTTTTWRGLSFLQAISSVRCSFLPRLMMPCVRRGMPMFRWTCADSGPAR